MGEVFGHHTMPYTEVGGVVLAGVSAGSVLFVQRYRWGLRDDIVSPL